MPNSNLLFISQLFFVSGIGVLILGMLCWAVEYDRILIYVDRYHREALLNIGVASKVLLQVQLISISGFVSWILSIWFAPKLFLVLFMVVFIIPTPLYVKAVPSLAIYWNNFWTREDLNFGDERLHQMRTQVKRRYKRFVALAAVMIAAGIGFSLVGILLRFLNR